LDHFQPGRPGIESSKSIECEGQYKHSKIEFGSVP